MDQEVKQAPRMMTPPMPGPLDLSRERAGRVVRRAEAVDMMIFLGPRIFAPQEVRLEPLKPLPSFMELIAEAYRRPGVREIVDGVSENIATGLVLAPDIVPAPPLIDGAGQE